MNITASIEIIGLSTGYTKKDIKRELKANGLGRVDSIKCMPTKNGLQIAYVWFRPTKKAFVLAKREELEHLISHSVRCRFIRVRCAETPRIFHPFTDAEEQNEEKDIYWCVRKGQTILPPREKAERMTEIERKIMSHETVIYQLLGGLFNQSTQNVILTDLLNILHDRPRSFSSQGDNIWPTTRQGDQLEEEVKGLKEEIARSYRVNESVHKKLDILEERFKSLASQSRTSMSRVVIDDSESDEECIA